jgi:arylsulfatase A-like enzyme
VPAIVRDPRAEGGFVVNAFTEAVDVMPTICEAMGLEIPVQCDGLPLTPFLRGDAPPWWRDAAHWEFDWRSWANQGQWPWDRQAGRRHLAVRRCHESAYVQFADATWCCFDLKADPHWGVEVSDLDVGLGKAQSMLAWRGEHADRTLTGMRVGKD